MYGLPGPPISPIGVGQVAGWNESANPLSITRQGLAVELIPTTDRL